MEEQRYIFKMPIGDWSGDGHEQCDWFKVISNKPVEEVREIHYKSRAIFDMEKVCSEYEDQYMSDKELNKLKELGYPEELILNIKEENIPFRFLNVWLFVLMKTDCSLKISIDESPDFDKLTFYGRDEKGRSIGFVGYGLFH